MTITLNDILARIAAAPAGDVKAIALEAVAAHRQHKDAILLAARQRLEPAASPAARKRNGVRGDLGAVFAQVGELLAPFAAIAKTVPNNQRKALTDQGGLLRGPDRTRIKVERYSAIKAGDINASVVCIVLRHGERANEPIFMLCHRGTGAIRERSIKEAEARAEIVCGVEGVRDLLARWSELAKLAGAPG